MARVDRKLQVTWTELKVLAASKYVGLHAYETSNATEVYIIEDGEPSFWAAIFKDNDERYVEADRTDWETNYALHVNGPTKPRDYDGRDKVQPVTVTSGQWHYWHSIGDSATALRDGVPFKLTVTSGTSLEDRTVVWRYRDPVWLAGGRLHYLDAEMDDTITFSVFAPATPVVSNGTNTGNANLVFPGIIIPADGDGAYDVDLDDAYPIPLPTANGYWNYVLPADMKFGGTVSVNAIPGVATPTGGYMLLAARFDLTRFVSDELLLGAGISTYEPQNINANLCIPEWRFECVATHGGGENTLQLVWRVLVSRYWTTV